MSGGAARESGMSVGVLRTAAKICAKVGDVKGHMTSVSTCKGRLMRIELSVDRGC